MFHWLWIADINAVLSRQTERTQRAGTSSQSRFKSLTLGCPQRTFLTLQLVKNGAGTCAPALRLCIQ